MLYADGITHFLKGLRHLFGQGFPCLFQLLTGLYCPGCGGTRALRLLFKGEFALSFQYHPLVLYGAAAVVLWSISYLLSRALKNPRLYLGHENEIVAGAVALVLLNWIFKNYMLVFRGVDLLPPL